MRKHLFLFILIAAIGLTGCLRDGIDTIALPFGKVPDAVIPPEVRNQFQQYMPIYEGITPPVIEGQYLAKPLTLVYTSDYQFNPGDVFSPQYFAYENQAASGMATYREQQGGGLAAASEVYIVGEGDCFTAYFVTNTTMYYEDGTVSAFSKESNIVSGRITEYGIEDYRYAFIMLEKYDPDHILMDVNEYRVFNDGDGLAARYNWSKVLADEKAGLLNKLQRGKSLNK